MSLQPSGGVSIILEYAEYLSEEYDITIILPTGHVAKESRVKNLIPDYATKLLNGRMKVMTFQSSELPEFDIVFATFWATIPLIAESNLRSKSWLHFCQSIEDRFTANPRLPNYLDIVAAQNVYGIKIPALTEAHWIVDVLNLRGENSVVHFLQNPLLISTNVKPKDKDKFKGLDDSKLVLVVEGESSWFKGVDETISALEDLIVGNYEVHVVGNSTPQKVQNHRVSTINHGRVTKDIFHQILASSDVLIKMSHVEGMYGPPLEAFYYGTTCITTAVTGHEEYIRHAENALVVEVSDRYGITFKIENLFMDRELLGRLNSNAFKTAQEWPTSFTIKEKLSKIVAEVISDRSATDFATYQRQEGVFWPKLRLQDNQEFLANTYSYKYAFRFALILLIKGQWGSLARKGGRYVVKRLLRKN